MLGGMFGRECLGGNVWEGMFRGMFVRQCLGGNVWEVMFGK